MATSQISLDQFSIDELIAAIAARGQQAATEHEQQTIRDQQTRVQAQAVADRYSRRNQSPVQWGQQLAEAGVPVRAASIFAEVLAIIFNRLEALEATKQPAHMQGVERRG